MRSGHSDLTARRDKQCGSCKAQGRQSGHRFNRLVGDFSWAVEIASAMNYAMSYVRRYSG